RDGLLTKIALSNYIVGKVYIDKDNNGVFDSNDALFSAGLISVTNNTKSNGAAIINGQYQVSADTGSNTIRLITADSNYFNIIPSQTVRSFNQYTLTDTVDFRLVKKADIADLSINLLPHSHPRPANPFKFTVKYENRGAIDMNAVTIKIAVDPKTRFVSSTL